MTVPSTPRLPLRTARVGRHLVLTRAIKPARLHSAPDGVATGNGSRASASRPVSCFANELFKPTFTRLCHCVPMNMHSTGSLKAAPISIEDRAHLRLPLYLPAFLLSPGDVRDPVVVTDISATGCRVTGPVHVTVGRYLGILIPGFAPYAGWVAWQARDGFGLDFTNPLPDVVVAHIIGLGLTDRPE